jgi:small subunit ribosomal protein S25e
MAQTFARTAGVKISVANAFLKALEAKGIIKNVGGNSGHKVYKLEKL